MVWSREAWTSPGGFVFPRDTAIVGLEDIGTAESVAIDHGVDIIDTYASLRAIAVSGGQASLRALDANGLFDSRVRYVEPLKRRTPQHQRNDPLTYTVDSRSGRAYQWTFRATHLDRALNISRGDPSVLVGIVDSGFGQVPDLSGKYNRGWYFPGESTNAFDDPEGHGTYVASVIASTNDDGLGLGGFCGSCRLNVFKMNELLDSREAAAIRRLTDDGVRIMNLSLGSPEFSSIEADAISYAMSKGVLVVAASGNSGAGAVYYPAALLQPDGGVPSYGLAVGASDEDGNRASYSNYGSRLSLLAPATLSRGCEFGSLGAIPGPLSFACDNQYLRVDTTGANYTYGEGTSFSAPQVAGVAALIWAARPNLKNYEVANIIKQAASRPVGALWNSRTGWGVLDAARALEIATGQSSADSVRLDVSETGPAEASRPYSIAGSATWQDGVPLLRGSVACTATVGGRGIAGSPTGPSNGTVSCNWSLPGSASAKHLTAEMRVADEDGNTASARIKSDVTDVNGPTVRALGATGKFGRLVSLPYRLTDDSGSARAEASIHIRGKVSVLTAPYRVTVPGKTYAFAWRAPKAPKAKKDAKPVRTRLVGKYCVIGIDRAENSSPDSCGRLVVK